jgi:hypothetical protein
VLLGLIPSTHIVAAVLMLLTVNWVSDLSLE